MISKNLYTLGFQIYILIMLVFFIVYFFFMGPDYFKISMGINAFLLPFIFALGAFISVIRLSKTKSFLTFKEVFKTAFIPMFIGGFLSFLSIFLFINYADKDLKQILNYQYLESFKTTLNEEYSNAKKIVKPNSTEDQELEKKYKEALVRINYKEEKKENMFSFNNFNLIFAGYLVYFLMLSLILGFFFRTKLVN